MMSVIASPMSLTARRGGLVDWLTYPEFTHAVHLAPNRHELPMPRLKRMFGRFCLEVDRYMLGTKHVHFRSSHDRLNMLMMPEKRDTNLHLHGVANFSADFWGKRLDLPWEWKLQHIWREVTEGSGTICIQADPDRGAAIYATKEAFRRDHESLHSWDFHRDDKLRKRPNATSLHSVVSHKAALNS